jgi:hypothetical protein
MLDPVAFEAVARRGHAALAWEVLRRDPAYRAAAGALLTIARSDLVVPHDFVKNWGLHFP